MVCSFILHSSRFLLTSSYPVNRTVKCRSHIYLQSPPLFISSMVFCTVLSIFLYQQAFHLHTSECVEHWNTGMLVHLFLALWVLCWRLEAGRTRVHIDTMLVHENLYNIHLENLFMQYHWSADRFFVPHLCSFPPETRIYSSLLQIINYCSFNLCLHSYYLPLSSCF